MGVRNWLADKLERVRAWARSVPPDVWIGLAIAAATLLVVWLAYRSNAKSSSSSGSTGLLDPLVGQPNSLTPSLGGGSGALTTGDVITPGTFDITKLWTGNGSVGSSNTSSGGGGGLNGLAGGHSPEIARQQKQSADLFAYAAGVKAKILGDQQAGAIVHSSDIHSTSTLNTQAAQLQAVLDQNESNGQQAVISAQRAQNTAAAAPISVTYHAGILSSAAYAPIKQAKNDAGIY